MATISPTSLTMDEEDFLTLKFNEKVRCHLKSGQVKCGAFKHNFSTRKSEFDFENHKTERIEEIQLKNIDMLVT